MSKITAEQLLAGIVFGDTDNSEYIYLPGGEVGSEDPFCIMERQGSTTDLPLEEAVHMVQRLQLKPCAHPELGKRSY